MILLRRELGDVLRERRQRQHRTLREVSASASVSLGYLSEVERGQKEASSELLASICRALGVRLSDLLREVSEELAVVEPHPLPQARPITHSLPVTKAQPVLESVKRPVATVTVHAVRDVVAAA